MAYTRKSISGYGSSLEGVIITHEIFRQCETLTLQKNIYAYFHDLQELFVIASYYNMLYSVADHFGRNDCVSRTCQYSTVPHAQEAMPVSRRKPSG